MNKQQKSGEIKNIEQQEITVNIAPEISKGAYSNVALIRHTQNEFVIDFLLQFDGSAQMVSRVIMSPNHMRAFKNAIEENLRKYDETYGKRPDSH